MASGSRALAHKSELKMAFITKHGMLSIINSPIFMLHSKIRPLSPHSLGQKRLLGHLHGGQLQCLPAASLDLTLTVLSSGMFFFSCNPVRVGVTFSLLFMLFRVAVENLEGRPLPGFRTGSRFSGFRVKSKSKVK
jgi:hypothetical protein